MKKSTDVRRDTRAPETDKRNTGPVKVLKPEDLINCSTLSQRMEMMVENRCEIFIHNVAFLCQTHGLNQSTLCSQKLENYLSSPQLTGYKKRGRDIPLSVMALVASAFGLTVEEMCGQLLDETVDNAEDSRATFGRPIEEYMKYAGTYDLTYFDTSAPIGQNQDTTANALDRGILTIYVTYNAIGVASFHVSAVFNCTPEERQKIASYMEGVDFGKDASAIRAFYEKVLTNPLDLSHTASRMKCLYEGEIKLTERITEITLRQVKGSDVAHLYLHNRAANYSEGKVYRGGLATMMSISRGAEHMPCIQAVMMMRGACATIRQEGSGDTARIPKCGLDYFQAELLASKIYLAPPKIELGDEIQKIVAYMKFLFSQEGEGGPLSQLSDEEKTLCLASFVEKKLTESLRRNILSHYKISLRMDSDVYEMIRQIL